MTLLYQQWDTDKQRTVLSSGLDQYNEVSFQVVAEEGVTEFLLAGYLLLTTGATLDVFRNGQNLIEGPGLDYVGDVANNKVVFSYTVPKTAKVKVRIYNRTALYPGAPFDENVFLVAANEGATEFLLDGIATLTASCNLDVFRNGENLVEGALQDYTRDVGNNKVVFNYTVPKTSKVRVRVYKA